MFSFLKRKKDYWKSPKCIIRVSANEADILKARRVEAERMALTCPQCNHIQQDEMNTMGVFVFSEEGTGLSVTIQTCELCGCTWETKCDLYNI